MASSSFDTVDKQIFRNKGAIYEADLFSILRRSPYIIRSWEFSAADGMLDCTKQYAKDETWAERWISAIGNGYPAKDPSSLIPFEVKSTVRGYDTGHWYRSHESQRRLVAFYLCICAADSTFVELIPNYHQEAAALADEEGEQPVENRDVYVNVSRVSRLPPSTYSGLDQNGTPYRMPLAFLPEALSRVRRCFLEGVPYRNPANGVTFMDWQPKATVLTTWLRPALQTPLGHSSLEVLELFRALRSTNIKADFVSLQPRVGDFSLDGRIVQHKYDDHLRAASTKFEHVQIARGDGARRAFYFQTYDRFDFLMYQFRVSRGKDHSPRTVFFFIPESELPDDLYTSEHDSASFNRPHFEQYLIEMDEDSGWMTRIGAILAAHPHPRRQEERPRRMHRSDLDKTQGGEVEATSGQPQLSSKDGRRAYALALRKSQRRFFASIMSMCAVRRRGLLIVLATNHPLGDFGYCRYAWTDKEKESYLSTSQVPAAGHTLPPAAELVPICYYTQHSETWYLGPRVNPRQFRRLDATDAGRLVLWDLAGPDGEGLAMLPVVIPSHDIRPSVQQRLDIAEATHDPEHSSMPILSDLLGLGYQASDYTVQSAGPLAYAGTDWSALLNHLDQYLGLSDFEHPANIKRNPSAFRQTMRSASEALVKQHGYSSYSLDLGGSGDNEDEDEDEWIN